MVVPPQVRIQGSLRLAAEPDAVVEVLGDRDDFENSYAAWRLGEAARAEVLTLVGDGAATHDAQGFDVSGGWFADDRIFPTAAICRGLDAAARTMRAGEVADVEIRQRDRRGVSRRRARGPSRGYRPSLGGRGGSEHLGERIFGSG